MFKTRYRVTNNRFKEFRTQRLVWWKPYWSNYPANRGYSSPELAEAVLSAYLKYHPFVKELSI